MTKVELKEVIRQLLVINALLEEQITVLKKFKEAGGCEDDAGQVLKELRTELSDERSEDRILEILDFVAGFCLPEKRIW